VDEAPVKPATVSITGSEGGSAPVLLGRNTGTGERKSVLGKGRTRAQDSLRPSVREISEGLVRSTRRAQAREAGPWCCGKQIRVVAWKIAAREEVCGAKTVVSPRCVPTVGVLSYQ